MRIVNMAGVAVVGCVLAAGASAVPVEPGEVVLINGADVADSPWLTGTGDVARFSAFEVRNEANVLIASGVVRSEHIRSEIFGTQIIQYRVENVQNFEGAVVRVSRVTPTGFAGLTTNADWRNAGPIGTAPTSVQRDVDPEGDRLQFGFTSANPRPGFDSPVFFIVTNATDFRTDGEVILRTNTGVDVVVTGVYAPAVPARASCDGDTTGDGVINFADLNSVLTNFGGVCP